MEIEFDKLAGEIFGKPPMNKKEITISFNINNFKELYETLLQFFVDGLKIKYGDLNGKVNLHHISKEEFDLMNKYMNSVGINTYFEIYSFLEFKRKYSNFIPYNEIYSKDLKDYKYYFNVDEKIYLIYFNFL